MLSLKWGVMLYVLLWKVLKSDVNTESNSKEAEMTVEDIAKTEEEIISEEMDIISSKPQSDINTATDIFDKTDANTWFSNLNGTKVTAEDIDKIVKGMTLEDVVNENIETAIPNSYLFKNGKVELPS
jgi:hypothetical protein